MIDIPPTAHVHPMYTLTPMSYAVPLLRLHSVQISADVPMSVTADADDANEATFPYLIADDDVVLDAMADDAQIPYNQSLQMIPFLSQMVSCRNCCH